MATRKTQTFLPQIFQTDTNQKFLSATMDQLVSEPDLQTLYGYIGRKFAPTYKSGDSYVIESSEDRQNYQLEPSILIKDDQNNVTFFATYLDLLAKIRYYGGITTDQNRLFEQEYYAFDPLISYDKLVNFSQYYWLPNGPDPVAVSTSGVDLTTTYTVERDAPNNRYIFLDNNGAVASTIVLARGGVYEFVVNQPGYPLWIQTELGTDGNLLATPTLSSRDVLGVVNNGIDVGTIKFSVPQSTAQDRFLSMTLVDNINYATPGPYYTWQNNTVSQFTARYPQWTGIIGQLNGKKLIIVTTDAYNNLGEEAWTNPTVHDNNGNVVPGYDVGYVVPDAERFGIWKVVLVDAGITNADGSPDLLIQMIYIQNVPVNEKVYIKYGLLNGNKEYYKDYDGFLKQTPLISATLNNLWLQDETASTLYQPIQIVEYAGWSIDVETEIIGKQNYTSPNGVDFTSGLKIQFGDDVTPAQYQNRQYYVEQVGDTPGGIKLIPVDELVTPEIYNDENSTNYPLIRVVLSEQVTKNIPICVCSQIKWIK